MDYDGPITMPGVSASGEERQDGAGVRAGFTNVVLEPIGRLHRTKAAYKAALKSLEWWANDAVGGD